MFRRFIGLCRRFFRSRGFRIGIRIFLWLFFISWLLSLIHALVVLHRAGITDREMLMIFFDIPLKFDGIYMTIEGVALGIVIGLVWFFRRKRRKESMEKEAEEEAEAKKPAEDPVAVQEEEFIEPPKYMSR